MYKGEPGYAMLDRKRRGILARMVKVGPFIMASPVWQMVKCGSKKCACAEDPKARHRKLHLSWADADGNGTCYVPKDLHEEVQEWAKNYWVMKELMKEMTLTSRQMIRIYAKTVGKVKRKQGRLTKKAA